MNGNSKISRCGKWTLLVQEFLYLKIQHGKDEKLFLTKLEGNSSNSNITKKPFYVV